MALVPNGVSKHGRLSQQLDEFGYCFSLVFVGTLSRFPANGKIPVAVDFKQSAASKRYWLCFAASVQCHGQVPCARLWRDYAALLGPMLRQAAHFQQSQRSFLANRRLGLLATLGRGIVGTPLRHSLTPPDATTGLSARGRSSLPSSPAESGYP